VRFQFTRPAWGAPAIILLARLPTVSIHAPRVGRAFEFPFQPLFDAFQFTRPAWGAQVGQFRPAPCVVSIHAPRVGRAVNAEDRSILVMFQFTRPAWGALSLRSISTLYMRFNSRAPRGARLSSAFCFSTASCFNSRAPRGARRGTVTPSLATRKVNDSAYPAENKGCSVVKEQSTRVSGCTTTSCKVREPP